MHSFFKALAGKSNIEGLPDHLAVEVLAENLLNGGTRSYSPHSHVIRGLDSSYVLSGSVRPLDGLRRYDGALRSFGSGGSLMVHPNSLQKVSLKNRALLEDRPFTDHRFYPLSSLRSVLYEMDGEWKRTKLHLEDVQISRYYRNLGGRTIEHSVAVSEAIVDRWDEIQDAYDHEMALCFYEEFAGVALRNPGTPAALPMSDDRRDGEWGSLSRSLYPLGDDESLEAIPLFAFYGEHTGDAEMRRLLEVLIGESGEDAGRFIFKRIMEPIIRAWVAVFESTGIIWEPHAQNVVFMCDPDSLEPKGIAFRDADTAVSLTKRNQLGLSCDTFFKANVHDGTPTDELPLGDRSEISRVLDVSMGKNTFEYLAKLYANVFAGDPEEMKSQCWDLFKQIWPAWPEWLTTDVYGYCRNPFARDRNCYPLEVKADMKPCWRPF